MVDRLHYIKNKIGLRIVPWGMPESTGKVLDIELIMQTTWCLSERYVAMIYSYQFQRCPVIPEVHSLISKLV